MARDSRVWQGDVGSVASLRWILPVAETLETMVTEAPVAAYAQAQAMGLQAAEPASLDADTMKKIKGVFAHYVKACPEAEKIAQETVNAWRELPVTERNTGNLSDILKEVTFPESKEDYIPPTPKLIKNTGDARSL